ncbi:hypothetical protein XHC_4179 [Xanthomonas hortorum pv. carotae str. M081]|nr:hypothetical protein XHC_4179 [Xanthomonas hortorum pv. carotae str. M081]
MVISEVTGSIAGDGSLTGSSDADIDVDQSSCGGCTGAQAGL